MLVVVGPRLQEPGTTAYAVTAFLLWPEMERIMSETKDASRELTETELDTVSGGLVVNAIIAILIPLLLPDPPKKAA
jgi:hypothetical protein